MKTCPLVRIKNLPTPPNVLTGVTQWVGILPQTERSKVRFQSGHMPGSPVGGVEQMGVSLTHRCFSSSLSPSLLLSLKINKIFLLNKRNLTPLQKRLNKIELYLMLYMPKYLGGSVLMSITYFEMYILKDGLKDQWRDL